MTTRKPAVDMRDALAREVRSRRAYLRMSQGELVAASGLSRSTITRIESGERDMSVPQLVAIAAALDIDPAALLTAAAEALDGD